MSPRMIRGEVFERKMEQRIMVRIVEKLEQFVDQFTERMTERVQKGWNDDQSYDDEKFLGENQFDDGDSCSEMFSEEEPLFDEYPLYDTEITSTEEYDGPPVYDEEILPECHVFDEMPQQDSVSRGKLSNFSSHTVCIRDVMVLQDTENLDTCFVVNVQLKPKNAYDSFLFGPVKLAPAAWISVLNDETGDTQHLWLAHLFNKPCFLGLLAIKADDISGYHANPHTPIVIGAQRRYEVPGDPLAKEIGTFFMVIVKILAYADYYERALSTGILSIQKGIESTSNPNQVYLIAFGLVQLSAITNRYIPPAERIILNVLSAFVHFSTCESIRMSQCVGVPGQRTLAVVTNVTKNIDSLLATVTTTDVHLGLSFLCVLESVGKDFLPRGSGVVSTKIVLLDTGTVAVVIFVGNSYRLQFPWVGVVNRSHQDINKRVDMTAPLQHSFISTGHDSYFTGYQLTSICSKVPVIPALRRGVWVIELDFWPNSATGGLHVLHGRTMTSPVTLDTCFNGLVTSPYPVIITSEDHLTSHLPAYFAEMITEILGAMLYCPITGIVPRLTDHLAGYFVQLHGLQHQLTSIKEAMQVFLRLFSSLSALLHTLLIRGTIGECPDVKPMPYTTRVLDYWHNLLTAANPRTEYVLLPDFLSDRYQKLVISSRLPKVDEASETNSATTTGTTHLGNRQLQSASPTVGVDETEPFSTQGPDILDQRIAQRGMFSLSLFPGPDLSKNVFMKDVLFVVNISGSMKLDHGDAFSILAFNDQTYLYSSALESPNNNYKPKMCIEDMEIQVVAAFLRARFSKHNLTIGYETQPRPVRICFDGLIGNEIVFWDDGAWLAGAKYQGDFKERILPVLKEVAISNERSVLFIDEFEEVYSELRVQRLTECIRLLIENEKFKKEHEHSLDNSVLMKGPESFLEKSRTKNQTNLLEVPKTVSYASRVLRYFTGRSTPVFTNSRINNPADPQTPVTAVTIVPPASQTKAAASSITTIPAIFGIEDNGISELRTIPFKGGGDDTDMGTEMVHGCSLTATHCGIDATQCCSLVCMGHVCGLGATHNSLDATQSRCSLAKCVCLVSWLI